MALFRKNAGISAHKWGTAAEYLNAVENNGFNLDMVEIPTPKTLMF